jgi:dTDP-4-dehydrorhamnose reductase
VLGSALVFGSGGQLGSELVRLLGLNSGVTHGEVSITDPAAVDSLISRRRPDVVFNCAAYNAVDRAEEERDLAFAVNGDGPRHLALACRRVGASLVHFSTNFVFDGRHDQPYVEADHAEPISVYGSSKLAGERAVLEAGAHVAVVRTAAVYGGPNSFPMRILQRARAGEELRVVSDQRVNPTFARDLAAAAVELAEQGIAGVVHAVADGCCGWDDFARATLAAAGVQGEVRSVPTSGYPAAARRPANGCLASTRIAPLRPWREALAEALNP